MGLRPTNRDENLAIVVGQDGIPRPIGNRPAAGVGEALSESGRFCAECIFSELRGVFDRAAPFQAAFFALLKYSLMKAPFPIRAPRRTNCRKRSRLAEEAAAPETAARVTGNCPADSVFLRIDRAVKRGKAAFPTEFGHTTKTPH
jgi:hypothetical protein